MGQARRCRGRLTIRFVFKVPWLGESSCPRCATLESSGRFCFLHVRFGGFEGSATLGQSETLDVTLLKAQREILKFVTLPSPPQIVGRINAILENPDAGILDIAEEIARDPPLAAKVLRVANSAFYGLQEPAQDIWRASIVLGIHVLRTIVLRVAVVQGFEHVQSPPELDLRTLWKHSILTGQVSRDLSNCFGGPRSIASEEIYTCGLLHDLGKIVMLEGQRDKYLEVLRDAAEHAWPAYMSEVKIFGFNHPQVGALVALHWNLPAEISQAIEFHHGPVSKLRTKPEVALVALGDHLANCAQEGVPVAESTLRDHPALATWGLTREAVAEAAERASEALSSIEI